MDTVYEAAAKYTQAGWKLCKIARGGKHPTGKGWQEEKNALVSAEGFENWTGGVGLLHAWSGTCAIDIDDLRLAVHHLAQVDIDLPALLKAPDALVLQGDRSRCKLIYRTAPLVTVKRNDLGFEFRCASALGTSTQDVLPPSMHNSGVEYRWLKGDFVSPPELPADLRQVWLNAKSLFPVSASVTVASSLGDAALVGKDQNTHQGTRNDRVSAECYKLVKSGMPMDEVRIALHAFNAQRCVPPLDDAEVETIWSHKAHIMPDPVQRWPDLPEGFLWKGNQIIEIVTEEAEDGAEVQVQKLLLKNPVYVSRVLRVRGSTPKRYIEVMVHGKGDIETHIVDMEQLVRKTESTLLDCGITVEGKLIPRVKSYLVRSKKMHEDNGATVDTFSSFGWQDDNSFVIGSRIYRAGQAPGTVYLSRDLYEFEEGLRITGSMEEWRGAAMDFMAPGNDSQAFAFLMGFASPLMRLSGERGGVYSTVGKSGQGKSTIQEAICTIYGETRAMRSRADDTQNAKMLMASKLCSLPLVVEELTKIDPLQLSNLVYSFSEGRDKHRATKDGGLKEFSGTWNMIVVSSSNRSLSETLMLSDGEAEAYRILEDTITLPKGADFSDGSARLRTMISNSGHAGHVFAQYLVDHREMLTESIDKTRRAITARVQATTKDRIRINMLSCAVVACAVLRNSGILAIDPYHYLNYGLQVLQNNMDMHKAMKSGAEDILADFINANVAGALRVRGANVVSLGNRNASQPIIMRYDSERKELYISRATLRKYLVERRGNWREFMASLSKSGMLKHEEQRMTLTRYTDLPPAPQTWCVVLYSDTLDLGEETIAEAA